MALLPVFAEGLKVRRNEVAQVQVCPDVETLHGPLQVLQAQSSTDHNMPIEGHKEAGARIEAGAMWQANGKAPGLCRVYLHS
jgi:hypothetical protein